MIKVIILLGQRVRSGTNFVGSTLSMHPDIETLPKETSLGEFNLFTDNYIVNVFSRIKDKSFGMNFSEEDTPRLLKAYGDFWMSYLKEKHKINDQKVLFIKSPYIDNLHLWELAFPDSKIAVIIRDGRDNVVSSVRASYDKRNWHSLWLKIKKKLNYYSGRSFVNHAKSWKHSAQKVIEIHTSHKLKVFKYESLNNSKEGVLKLLEFYDLDASGDIIVKCLKAPVVGSSFGVNFNNMIKPNWKPDYDKSKFKFTHKWTHWSIFKKVVFKIIAIKELKDLDYDVTNF